MVTDRQTAGQTNRQMYAVDSIIPRDSFRRDNNNGHYVCVECRSALVDTRSWIKKVSPRGRRDDMPPFDGRSIQKSRRIYVRPRTGPQSAHLWWPAVAKVQTASVPIAWAAAPWDRQTDGSRYSKMPPLWRGHNKGHPNGCSVFVVWTSRRW